VSADGASILAAVPVESLTRIISIPISGGAPRTLFTMNSDVWSMDAGADGSALVNAYDRPAEIFRFSERGVPPEKIMFKPREAGWRKLLSRNLKIVGHSELS